MCGIAGLLLSPGDLEHVRVDDMLKTLALEIESRGKDATGVGRLTISNRFRVAKAPSKASTFFERHPQIGDGCRLAFVHTRAWTKGDAKQNENNHPLTCGPITGIHNGCVGNDDALYAKYGWDRAAKVDSEVIFAAINNLGWKEALEMLEGSIACAWHDLTKPGHLFVARHTSSPLNIGITESGSVLFASTNAAVAKAATALGSSITIDTIKEGVMCEFWIGPDGKLESDIQQFDPPKPIWSRQGSWQYTEGAWLPADNRSNVVTFPRQQATSGTKQVPAAARREEWELGMHGWVLKEGDAVVFVPQDGVNFTPTYGIISMFTARKGFAFVEVAFDRAYREDVCLPLHSLMPRSEYLKSEYGEAPLALPPAKKDVTDEDFYCPRNTTDLVDAVEEIFGIDVLNLLPGYAQWLAGELEELEFVGDDVIDVEEAITDG